MNKLTIGQLAKKVGLRTSALRYYEKEGLISAAERTPAGYRLYEPQVIEEIHFIQRAQRLGFSLGQIRELLEERREGSLDGEKFIRAAEKRYLELERQATQLMVLKHELNLFIQDAYQTVSQPELNQKAFSRWELDKTCPNPKIFVSTQMLAGILREEGCPLTSEEAELIFKELSVYHFHIWQIKDGYSILIVSSDERVRQNLEKLIKMEADCQIAGHHQGLPELNHNDEGFLLQVYGEHAFFYVRLLLEAQVG